MPPHTFNYQSDTEAQNACIWNSRSYSSSIKTGKRQGIITYMPRQRIVDRGGAVRTIVDVHTACHDGTVAIRLPGESCNVWCYWHEVMPIGQLKGETLINTITGHRLQL